MFDRTFFAQAEQAIMQVLTDVKPKLMEAYGNVEFITKADHTVVTDLDKSIEPLLREALLKVDPRIGLLGEEFGQEGSTDTYWLLDPIDGTEQFIRGLPGCKNLVCLMHNGRPVWGLTYFFVKDELWIAEAGKGATMNGSKVEMKWRPLERCWVEVSVDWGNPAEVQKLVNLRPHIGGFNMRTSYDNFALGRVDGYYNLSAGGGPWDYWPRYLLLTETGGRMANIGKADYNFETNNFLMAHERNFDALMKLVA